METQMATRFPLDTTDSPKSLLESGKKSHLSPFYRLKAKCTLKDILLVKKGKQLYSNKNN